MSELNYIIEMLELKDNNIKFYKNCYHKEKIKGIFHKVFEGVLTYQPICCEKCGVLFDNNFEKHSFITSNIKIPDGAMSFHMCNGQTGQTIDIVENRKLLSLLKYFDYYSFKARKSVKFIIIDMYSPYVSLIQKMFPNVQIIIDTFHLIQLISRSLNNTRIHAIKSNKNSYNKMKRYWKLILKDRNELDCSKWKKYTCFPNLMTEIDVVNYILDQSVELKTTYYKYQELLQSIREKNYDVFIYAITNVNNSVSDYMKTSIKTLIEFKDKIYNTFNNNYHNGYIEGNNNFIKVLKRIVFGFRSFRRFKTRIMICKGLIKINRKKASAFALASYD